MPTGLDLHLFPLYRQNGREMPSLPGVLTMTPPRRAARGREQDRLIVYLALTGNTPFSTADYMQAASQVASRFYQTPGSLTFAMRSAAQALNDSLLERNLLTTGRGQFAIGWLTLAALREAQLFLLLSGPMHAFVLTPEAARHIYDADLSGRGLGLSQALTGYFARTDLQPGQYVLLCSQCGVGWESALAGGSGSSSPNALRRRLMTLTTADVNAVLIRTEQGNGELIYQKGERTEETTREKNATETLPAPVQPETSAWYASSQSESSPRQDAAPSAYAIPPQPENPLQVTPDARLQQTSPADEALPETDATSAQPSRHPRLSPEQTRRAARTALNLIDGWRRVTAAIGRGAQKILPLLLPHSDPQEPVRLPSWWMTFIAIAVPLVVVTIASLVYFSLGVPVENDEYYRQAQAAAARALSEGDPVRQREAWEQTLALLNLLEERRKTPESQALRQQARARLDELLGIIRLDFQPVLNASLGSDIRITRMAATDTELYLLDDASDQVLRIFLAAGGYQRDANFICRKGLYAGHSIGDLVDIIILPRGNATGASLLGIDAAGNLIYCAPNQQPEVVALPPPDTGWGRVAAAVFDNQILYVLDSSGNAVWMYFGDDSVFKKRPAFYFDDQIPPLMGALDLAVNGDDLYILHADGHLTTCTYGRLDTVPTRCVDPSPLTDPHPAVQGQNPFQKKKPKQILISAPPDSALLLLDEAAPIVYRFSPRTIELQSQIYPPMDARGLLAGGIPSAMTMNANHVLFLAFGDRVYFAGGVP